MANGWEESEGSAPDSSITPFPGSTNLEQPLENRRKELLDLSTRNRLLSMPVPKWLVPLNVLSRTVVTRLYRMYRRGVDDCKGT